MPLPSTAVNSPTYLKHDEGEYCHWSGPSQGLTWQRTIRALENYGHFAEVTMLGNKLITRLAELGGQFPVQFDPINRKPYGNHYGPTALAALEYISHIYGVTFNRGELWWSAVAPAKGGQMDYTQTWFDKTWRLVNSDGQVSAYINGRLVFQCTSGVHIVTDVNGKVLRIVGIAPSAVDVALVAEGKTLKLKVKPNKVYSIQKGIAARLPAAPFEAAKAIR